MLHDLCLFLHLRIPRLRPTDSQTRQFEQTKTRAQLACTKFFDLWLFRSANNRVECLSNVGNRPTMELRNELLYQLVEHRQQLDEPDRVVFVQYGDKGIVEEILWKAEESELGNYAPAEDDKCLLKVSRDVGKTLVSKTLWK